MPIIELPGFQVGSLGDLIDLMKIMQAVVLQLDPKPDRQTVYPLYVVAQPT